MDTDLILVEGVDRLGMRVAIISEQLLCRDTLCRLAQAELQPEQMDVYDALAAYRAAGANRPAEYGGSGGPSNIIRSHSLDAELLKTAFQAGMHLINGPSPLSRAEREMIATAVSAANRCFY